jgi:hypothetical protein
MDLEGKNGPKRKKKGKISFLEDLDVLSGEQKVRHRA